MLELNFDPFPVMSTERLILRKIIKADVPDMFMLRSNEESMRYLDRPLAVSTEEIVDLIQKMEDGISSNTAIVWAITLKENSRLIGTVGFHQIHVPHYRAEIGYMLLPEFWHKGITTEAVTAAINYAFNEMKVHSLEAHINPHNEASRNLLLKHHFVKEGYFKESYYYKGNFLDTEVLSRLAKAKPTFLK